MTEKEELRSAAGLGHLWKQLTERLMTFTTQCVISTKEVEGVQNVMKALEKKE